VSNELLGMRHVALHVKDMVTTRHFYEGLVGMKAVWVPDPDNVYLSSGADNVALHTAPANHDFEGGNLDHMGFLYRSVEGVDTVYARLVEANIFIAKERKHHRDDSYSFYAHDPDGVLVQFLFEPNVAAHEAKS
jgi:catechol 2,3-dioxygenase-like lactoylglutathione lyase family enzyme